MVLVCVGLGRVCRTDLHACKNRHRRRGFQSRNGDLNRCGRVDGVGYGVPDPCAGLSEISKKSWVFLILSGLATGVSWLCYYKALQTGAASKVVPIDKLSVVITLILAFVFLHEEFTVKSVISCVLIGAGTLLMVL